MYARGKGALRQHKTTESKGIGMSTRTAIATIFLHVLIFFGGVRKFEYDFVVRKRLTSFFSVKSIIRLRNDATFRSG